MTTADEIRKSTARNELHPLVAKNHASPRGLCNSFSDRRADALGLRLVLCTLDYGHDGQHVNGAISWSAQWPPSSE